MVLLSIAAALACGCFGGNAGGAAQGALTFHEFTDYKQGLTMFGSGYYGQVDRTARVGKGYTAPKAIKKPVFFTLVSLNQGGARGPAPFVGVLGKSDADLKSPDLMWIDWNFDKKFEDDEELVLVPGAGLPGADVFKPKVWPKIDGRTVYAAVELSRGNYLNVIPAGYMESTVELDGKSMKIGVMDANLNGAYGDFYGSPGGCDVLLIDRDGDGKFDPPQYTSEASLFDGEVSPLLALTQLNGKFYEIQVSKDASAIAVNPNTDPTGGLTAPNVKAGCLIVQSPKGMLFVEPGEGQWRLPAGSYTLQTMEYKVSDPKGAEWSLTVGAAAGKRIQVSADQVDELKCGPPFSVAMRAESMRGMHYFSLDIKDRGGASLSNLADAKGGRPAPPKLAITDSKGKPVKSLAFSYG